MPFLINIILLSSTLLSSTKAATIADLIRQRASLSRAAAQIANHPEWSAPGPITLFLPTDAALNSAGGVLPAGSLGSLTVAQAIDYKTTVQYQVITDIDGTTKCIYDDYQYRQNTPLIHCRTGVGDSIATEWLQADNGWLYVMNAVIEPPLSMSKALERRPENSRFLDLIKSASDVEYVDSLKDVTVFPFTNAAYTADVAARIQALTLPQKQGLVRSFISVEYFVSTALQNNKAYQSALTGHTITILTGQTANGEYFTRANGANIMPSDSFIANGVMHQVESVVFPAKLPDVSDKSLTATIPVSTISASKSPSVSPTPTKPATSDALGISANFIYFGLAVMTGLFYLL